MKQSKTDQAWALFKALMRQYPLWPNTFSPCACGRADGRGGGKCALCIKEELAALVGMPVVDKADNALKDVAEAWYEILLKARNE